MRFEKRAVLRGDVLSTHRLHVDARNDHSADDRRAIVARDRSHIAKRRRALSDFRQRDIEYEIISKTDGTFVVGFGMHRRPADARIETLAIRRALMIEKVFECG